MQVKLPFKLFIYQIFLCIFLPCARLHPSQTPQNEIFLELNSPPFGNGMFNVCSMVLGLVHMYEERTVFGIKVDFKEEGVYYDPAFGPNWWNYYFEPICLGDETGMVKHVANTETHCHLACFGEFGISRHQAFQLLQHYVHVKSAIQSKIAAFQHHYFGNAFIIGIHYRGTDKILEAPRVEYHKVKEKVQSLLGAMHMFPVKIFVATDEQAFLDYMVQQFPNVVFYTDCMRSHDGQAVHRDSIQNHQKGECALIDCILLSKCHVLVRTSSNLSLFSSYFNPYVPIINLNYRHGMDQ